MCQIPNEIVFSWIHFLFLPYPLLYTASWTWTGKESINIYVMCSIKTYIHKLHISHNQHHKVCEKNGNCERVSFDSNAEFERAEIIHHRFLRKTERAYFQTCVCSQPGNWKRFFNKYCWASHLHLWWIQHWILIYVLYHKLKPEVTTQIAMIHPSIFMTIQPDVSIV